MINASPTHTVLLEYAPAKKDGAQPTAAAAMSTLLHVTVHVVMQAAMDLMLTTVITAL